MTKSAPNGILLPSTLIIKWRPSSGALSNGIRTEISAIKGALSHQSRSQLGGQVNSVNQHTAPPTRRHFIKPFSLSLSLSSPPCNLLVTFRLLAVIISSQTNQIATKSHIFKLIRQLYPSPKLILFNWSSNWVATSRQSSQICSKYHIFQVNFPIFLCNFSPQTHSIHLK